MNAAPAVAVPANNDDFPNIVKAAMFGGSMVGLFVGLSVKECPAKETALLMIGFSGLGFISGYTVYFGSLAVLDSVDAVVNRFRRR